MANLAGITLEVTEDCNLACRYCYEAQTEHSNGPPRYMDEATGFRAIRWLLENFGDRNVNPTISFWGGEPLLNFDLIKKIVSYCKSEYDRSFFFSLVTNGTLLSPTVLDYLRSEHFHIILSLDGPAHVHDKNRCFSNGLGSFQLIEPAIQTITSEFLDALVLFTVCPDTVEYMAESCSYLAELGFKRISFSYAFTSKWNKQAEQKYLDQVDGIVTFWEEEITKDHHIAILSVENVLHYFINNKPIECSAANRMVSIGSNGNIYPCHRFCGFYNIRDCYNIGNIWTDGINQKALLQFKATQAVRRPGEHISESYTELFGCQAEKAWEGFNGTSVSNEFRTRLSNLFMERMSRFHSAMYREKNLPYLEVYLAIKEQGNVSGRGRS